MTFGYIKYSWIFYMFVDGAKIKFCSLKM